MKSIYKLGSLIVCTAFLGVPGNVFAHFSFDASHNCAQCHNDGRTWQSVHGGGGGGGSTPAPTPVPTPPPVIFNGLVGDGHVGNGTQAENAAAFLAENGFVTVSKFNDGTFSGNVRLAGKALPIRGKFSPVGNATVSTTANATAKLDAKRSAAVSLSYDGTTKNITGNVALTNNGTVAAPLAYTALLEAYSGVKPNTHPLSGKHYTVIVPSPDASLGHGYATLAVDAKGTAKLVGKLADGTAITSTSLVGDDGGSNWVIPVHVFLYKSLGVVTGELQLPKTEPVGSAAVLGTFQWVRPADLKAKTYKDGFFFPSNAGGLAWTALTKASSALIPGGGFTLNVNTQSFQGTWSATNVPALPKPSSISLTTTSGLLKGNAVTLVNNKAVKAPYEGVILASPLTLTTSSGNITVQGAGFSPRATGSTTMQLTVP